MHRCILKFTRTSLNNIGEIVSTIRGHSKVKTISNDNNKSYKTVTVDVTTRWSAIVLVSRALFQKYFQNKRIQYGRRSKYIANCLVCCYLIKCNYSSRLSEMFSYRQTTVTVELNVSKSYFICSV